MNRFAKRIREQAMKHPPLRTIPYLLPEERSEFSSRLPLPGAELKKSVAECGRAFYAVQEAYRAA